VDDNDEQNSLVGWILGIAVTLAITVALTTGIMAVTANAPAGTPAAAAPAGAPAVAATVAKVYFDTGKVDAPADAGATLQPVVDAAKAKPDARLAVSGFHDATGSAEANAEIARQRAMSVRAALVAAGIAEARIELRKPQQTQGGTDDREARRVEVGLE
jgi:outer membrane protein OmpA-like peptidoglycan-associated protein